jgi:predicted nucleic acid-binding protein
VRVLLDTNVVLEVLLDREPHAAASSALLGAVESKLVDGLVGATTVTTIYYLAARAVGPRRARKHVEALLSLCEVAPVDSAVLHGALGLGFPDFEDAVLHEAARHARAGGIVTRDQDGFRKAELPIYSPGEMLAVLRGS